MIVNRRLSLGLAVALAGASTAFAQQYLTPGLAPAAKPAAARKAPAAPPPQPARPVAAAAAPPAGRPDLAEDFGDWRLECVTQPMKVCHLFQRRVNATSHALLVWVEVTRTGGDSRLTVMVPLGFKAGPSLGLVAAGQPAVEVPILTCIPAGCVHAKPLDPTLLKTLRESKDLSAIVSALNGQTLSMSIAPRGFNEGYQRLNTFFGA